MDRYKYEVHFNNNRREVQRVIYVDGFHRLTALYHAIQDVKDRLGIEREIYVYADEDILNNIVAAVEESSEWTNKTTMDTLEEGYHLVYSPCATALKLGLDDVG